MSDPVPPRTAMGTLGDALMRGVREDLNEQRKIGREQTAILTDMRDLLAEIRLELKAAREEREARGAPIRITKGL